MRCSASLLSTVAPPEPTSARGPGAGAHRRPGTLLAWLTLATGLCLLPGLSVDAQSSQYTAPGGTNRYELPTAEGVEAEMAAARWRLGGVRLAPWFGLRGLSYEQDVFVDDENETSDITGTVGAGLTAYLPTGSRVFWIAQAMPEYVFWLDLTERNEFIGRYGGGVVADLNRLQFVANVHRVEEQSVVTLESPQRVLAERTGVTADAVLDLSRTFALALSLSSQDLAYGVTGDNTGSAVGGFDFARLDRDEQSLAAGVRFQPSDAVTLSVGVELTETDFASGARDLSSTGTSPYLSLDLDGNKISFLADLLYLELEPEPGSRLVPVAKTTGSARLSLTPGWRFSFGLYGHRNVTFSLDDAYSHFLDDRVGVDISAPFGEKLSARAFFESGSADFVRLASAAAQPQRNDDVTAYGLEATYDIGEWLRYRAGFHQVEIDSNLPGFDRDYLRFTSTFVLSTGDWAWR